MVIYNSLILSNFKYCPIVGHFCNKRRYEKMKKKTTGMAEYVKLPRLFFQYPYSIKVQSATRKYTGKLATCVKHAFLKTHVKRMLNKW